MKVALSDNGKYAYCGREEYAGDLSPADTRPITYRHYLAGPCRCGQDHTTNAPLPDRKQRPRKGELKRRYTLEQSRAYYQSQGYAYVRTDEVRDPVSQLAAYHDRYKNADGDKICPWRAPDGLSDLPADVGVNDLPLFGSETVRNIPLGAAIPLTEGEEAALALLDAGVNALGTVTGADELPCDESLRVLTGYKVILWPDHDIKGAEHMRKIAERLTALGIEHRWLNWPEAPDHGDAADYLALGGTVEGIEAMVTDDSCDSANCEESEFSPDQGDNSHNSQFARSQRQPPAAMREDAYHGLAGEIVHAVKPHTEADPAGILIQFLALFGALVGRTTYFQVSGTRHYPILFANLVGDTAKGRKGMSWGVVRYVFSLVRGLDVWLQSHVLGGLSSGEGLIHAVSDYKTEEEGEGGKKRTPPLPTQTDKRVIVYESEFASVLKMPVRDGNTLSEVIRRAWDGDVLQTLTKNSPERATDAHICIVGNITAEEVTRYLDDTARANGLGNRFLWAYVKRSQLLPDGGNLTKDLLQPLADKLRDALDFAQGLKGHVMTRDPQARLLWHKEYVRLSEGYPGMFGMMTARAEAQVMRLACIYALLDKSQLVKLDHLKAALAVWAYGEDSVRFIFGDILGDPTADTILRALRIRPDGMTRTEIIALFNRHIKADALSRALDLLREHGLARCETKKDTGGAPEERWFAVTSQDSANKRSANNAKKEAA